jgi:hypothetical protein
MGLLLKLLPPAPKMSEAQYFKYRLRLLVLTLIWLSGILVAIFFWDGLHILVKAFLSFLGIIFVPDVGILEQLFVPYVRYLKESLN